MASMRDTALPLGHGEMLKETEKISVENKVAMGDEYWEHRRIEMLELLVQMIQSET